MQWFSVRQVSSGSSAVQAPRTLNVAVAGLGRMGARHALHFLERTPRARLVAAFSPDEAEHQWAQERLAPWGVKLYRDYDEMLAHAGLEAVVIATATTVHAEQTVRAIDKGLHVLCEKPLSTDVQVVSLFFMSSVEGLPTPSSHKACSPQRSSAQSSKSCAASAGASTPRTGTRTRE